MEARRWVAAVLVSRVCVEGGDVDEAKGPARFQGLWRPLECVRSPPFKKAAPQSWAWGRGGGSWLGPCHNPKAPRKRTPEPPTQAPPKSCEGAGSPSPATGGCRSPRSQSTSHPLDRTRAAANQHGRPHVRWGQGRWHEAVVALGSIESGPPSPRSPLGRTLTRTQHHAGCTLAASWNTTVDTNQRTRYVAQWLGRCWAKARRSNDAASVERGKQVKAQATNKAQANTMSSHGIGAGASRRAGRARPRLWAHCGLRNEGGSRGR